MDISLTTHKNYLNRPVTDLPTPALVISRPVLERNVARVHSDVENLGIAFRPHVKTLKTVEATRVMLGNGKHRRVVASTLCEIRGLLPLVKEGVLDQCLYGLPIRPSVLSDLDEFIAQGLEILLMIDHEDHVKLLEEYSARTSRNSGQPWKAFIKIDIGSHRAGVENSSPRLDALIAKANASSHVEIYGFYCHAGHSYASRTTDDAVKALEDEFGGVFEASKKLTSGQQVVLSIGATPTAHVVSHLRKSLPAGMTLELHAGNFPANDLQQFATGLVAETDQAVRVLAEVCSVYPERNEALINAGVLALTREPGPITGLARLTGDDKFDWSILRVSQEHGILGWAGDSDKTQKAEDVFSIGQKVLLYTQHACITSAMYHIYYVVDEEDIVRETWTPWKGW